jgi:hypothetical protein
MAGGGAGAEEMEALFTGLLPWLRDGAGRRSESK